MDNDIYAQVFNTSFDAIMVTDQDGVIILANPATAKSFRMPLEQIIGKTPREMIRRGIYHNSTVLKAMETGQTVTELVDFADHRRLSSSIPLLREDGTVYMVITNSRSDDTLNEFSRQLADAQTQQARYQEIADYLSGVNTGQLIYQSRAMAEVVEQCNSVAVADSPVLITGESGVGKELIAQMIHSMSPRKGEAFIPVNCSAIPAELFESELFGYLPGAFTGANTKGKLGLIQMADKGTLFLDELGELPLSMQSKLLRFAESGEVHPVGASTPQHVDVRIVAATNRNLLQQIAENLFRADLYYRLSVVPIHVPPLRDRPDDLEVLAVHFLDRFNKKHNRTLNFSDYDLRLMQQYSWPGNVRELRNLIERAVLLYPRESGTSVLQTIFPKSVVAASAGAAPPPPNTCTANVSLDLPLEEAMADFERHYIQAVLEKHHGRCQQAANSLGVHRSTLYRKSHPSGGHSR